MNRLYRWDRYLAGLLMLSFFLPLRVQVFVMIPVSVFFAGRDIIHNKDKKNNLLQALMIGSLYLLYAAWLPFTFGADKKDLLFQLEQKSGLLLLPLLFACTKPETRKTISDMLPVFVGPVCYRVSGVMGFTCCIKAAFIQRACRSMWCTAAILNT